MGVWIMNKDCCLGGGKDIFGRFMIHERLVARQ